MKLPAYGRELWHLRMHGWRPSDPVVITDLWAVATIYRKAVDWFALVVPDWVPAPDLRLLEGLDVIVVLLEHDDPTPLRVIRAAKPATLELWQVDDWIACKIRGLPDRVR